MPNSKHVPEKRQDAYFGHGGPLPGNYLSAFGTTRFALFLEPASFFINNSDRSCFSIVASCPQSYHKPMQSLCVIKGILSILLQNTPN